MRPLSSQVATLFQSTHPYGVRLIDAEYSTDIDLFQSTHPYGVRRTRELDERERTIISINAPLRSATSTDFHGVKVLRYFNQRTPTECDLRWTVFKKCDCVFQSTHPYGVRLEGADLDKQIRKFQSTHPYGVRLMACCLSGHCLVFQSTHPYGVRRSQSSACRLRIYISINAPLRSATVVDYSYNQRLIISINAPLRSVTLSVRFIAAKRNNFNQRTPTECDVMVEALRLHCRRISINASLRSATENEDERYSIIDISINAPLRSATK